MVDQPEILVSSRDGVARITLNRPTKKNALTDDMYRALHAAFTAAADDDAVGAVMLCANGESFCAGRDLGEFAAANVAAAGGTVAAESTPAARFMYLLAGFEKPIVAAVDGVAIGFGTTILLHCDIVYVTARARLTCGFAALGLSPEAASSLLLPAAVGPQRAFAMFTLGLPATGADAVEWGLALDCVEPEQVIVRADETASKIASLPAGSLTAIKRLLRPRMRLEESLTAELALFGARLASVEARDAFAAFRASR